MDGPFRRTCSYQQGVGGRDTKRQFSVLCGAAVDIRCALLCCTGCYYVRALKSLIVCVVVVVVLAASANMLKNTKF